MADTTPIANLPYPVLGDEPNMETAVKPLAEALDSVVNVIFATTGARDAAIPDPVEGQECYVSGYGKFFYNGELWLSYDPAVLVPPKQDLETVASGSTITSTTWADHPQGVSVTVDTPAPLYGWVEIGGLLSASGSNNSVRGGYKLTGATTLANSQTGFGEVSEATATGWGMTSTFLEGIDAQGQVARGRVKLNTGTTTITYIAYRANTNGSCSISYPNLRFMPDRWVMPAHTA